MQIAAARVSQLAMEEAAPKRTKAGKYNWRLWQEFIRDREKNKLRGNGTLRDEKTKREIRKLDVEIDRMLGKLVAVEDVQSQLQTYAAIVNTTLESWESEAAALSGDAVLASEAHRLTQRTRTVLASAVRDAAGGS